MNKAVNVFSLAVLAIFTLLSLALIYDLSISNVYLRETPFLGESLTTLAILFFLIGLIRVRRRWQGFKDMLKFSQFQFEGRVSKPFLQKGAIFTALEIGFMSAALILFARLSLIDQELMMVIMCVLVVLIIEALFFLIQLLRAGKAFKVGINDKVIAYYSREMHLIYYTGLRRVELHQEDLISFKYKDDLVLFFPAPVLISEDRVPFRDALIKQLEEKNIYFDDALRNWK